MTVDNVAPILPEIEALSQPLASLLDLTLDDQITTTPPAASPPPPPPPPTLLPIPTLSENGAQVTFAYSEPPEGASPDLALAEFSIASQFVICRTALYCG